MTRVHLNFHCVVSLLVSCLPAFSSSVGPKTETLQAWDNYIQRVKSRTIAVGGDRGFLWMDQDPQRAERVHRGEILAGSELGSGPEAVPHGLIHDWVGAVFIPGATLAQVFAVLEDYGRYNEVYKPGVIDAALVCKNQTGDGTDEETFRVRYAQKFLFSSEVLESEYEIRHVRLDRQRWYSFAQSTRLQETSNPVKPGERPSSGDEPNRYIWRVAFSSRYQQRDGGVYVEQENIVLSRGIPISLRWLIDPAVRQLSRDVVLAYLRDTRDAVLSLGRGQVSAAIPAKAGS